MKSTAPDPLPRHGDRIGLRRLSTSDLPEFQAYRADAEVGRYQEWSVMSSAEALEFLAEMAVAPMFQPDEWFQFAITSSETNRLIGDIGVCVHRGEERFAEIGFTLSRSAQGRGLATDAVRETLRMLFECAQVEYVVAITDTRNLPSIKLLRRVGMSFKKTVEATFRGEPCTEHVFEARQPRVTEEHGGQVNL